VFIELTTTSFLELRYFLQMNAVLRNCIRKHHAKTTDLNKFLLEDSKNIVFNFSSLIWVIDFIHSIEWFLSCCFQHPLSSFKLLITIQLIAARTQNSCSALLKQQKVTWTITVSVATRIQKWLFLRIHVITIQFISFFVCLLQLLRNGADSLRKHEAKRMTLSFS